MLVSRRSTPLAFWAILALHASASAWPAEEPPTLDWRNLVVALDSEEFQTRSKAGAELARWVDRKGPDGEEALKPLCNHASAQVAVEIKKQLARIAAMREDDTLFAWYDGLGFPDPEGKPYGRIGSGSWRQAGKIELEYTQGFLVDEKPDAVRIIVGWQEQTIPRRREEGAAGKEQAAIADFERIDFNAAMTELCKETTEEAVAAWAPFRGMRTSTSLRFDLFFLARCAAQRGLYGESRCLMELAGKATSNRGQKADAEELVRGLKNDLAHSVTWQTVLACNLPEPSREDLLRRFEIVLRHFPGSPHEAAVKEMAEQLKKMIAEDRAHAQAPPRKLEELTRDERMAELIYQLREQNGHQYMQPGECDIFDDWGGAREKRDSPAHRLVAMGFEAVPALIGLLEDKRLTRSVGYHRNFHFSHYVLRYGDCARSILERIAGRAFYQPRSTSSYMTRDGEEGAIKKAVEDWWQEVQEKGEEQVLQEAVGLADPNSIESAKRLLNLNPDRGVRAVVEAARKADNPWVRSALTEIAGETGNAAADSFLVEELRGPCLESRLTAMRALWKRRKPEALEAAMAEVRGTAPPPTLRDPTGFGRGGQGGFALFLLDSGVEEALRCVRTAYSKLRIDERLAVIQHIGGLEAEPKFAEFLEGMLVEALDDDERRTGMSGSRGDMSYSDPRLGDMAALVLSERWKMTPPFPLDKSELEQARYLVKLKNQWRAKKGEAPLPLPEAPAIPAVEPERAQSLFGRLKEARTDAVARTVLQGYRDLELAGLAPLQEALRALPEGNPARQIGDETVAELASIVREIRISPKSLALLPKVQEGLAALRGRPLKASQFFAWIRAFMKEPKGGCSIQLERSEQGHGVVLKVSAFEPKGHPGGVTIRGRPGPGADSSTRYKSGEEVLGGGSGGGVLEHYRTAAWDDDEKMLHQILTAPPSLRGEASITISWKE